MSDRNDSPKRAGGYARANKLSSEERSKIASDAAKARWDARPSVDLNKLPHVLEGFSNVLEIAGVKIPCAVIDGPNGIQRVLTENGITLALLGSRSGASK